MKDNAKYIIGLMSGTSLDGIDLVYVSFNKSDYSSFNIIVSTTVPYSKEWQCKLQSAINYKEDQLKELDFSYGKLLGETLNNFILKNDISKIDFIASHGHTILHEPDKGITLQIGNGQVISNITKQKVICDFRTQDVNLGGQGAPLVPIGDELLFSEFKYCMNLGGFSNISFNDNGKRIAFDICPVNIVMNHYCQKIGLKYDDKGSIASKGTIVKKLLDELNCLEFYKKEYPKSLGLEWVKENVFPIIDAHNLKTEDLLRTFNEHVAIQISKVLVEEKNVLVTGGGVYNDFLINRIRFLSNAIVVCPNAKLIEFKEALIFAFLGLLRNENKVNCLKSVTGAKEDHSSGVVFSPK